MPFNECLLFHFSPQCLSPAPTVDVALPGGWMPWDLCHPFELVKLSAKSEAYREVENNFHKTLPRSAVTVKFIFRVQNYTLYSTFCRYIKLLYVKITDSTLLFCFYFNLENHLKSTCFRAHLLKSRNYPGYLISNKSKH